MSHIEGENEGKMYSVQTIFANMVFARNEKEAQELNLADILKCAQKGKEELVSVSNSYADLSDEDFKGQCQISYLNEKSTPR